MKTIILILISIGMNPININSQEVEFEKFNYILIEPSQVNRYYLEQINNYIDNYFEVTQKINLDVKIRKAETLKIQSKRRLKKKDKNYIRKLEEDVLLRNKEISEIEICKNNWESLYLDVTTKAFKFELDENKCYEIYGTHNEYYPLEYRIEKNEIGSTVNWLETVLATKTVYAAEVIETHPASTKWVKTKVDKKCISKNPDDCYVWCLVETPPQYERTSEEIVYNCPEEFSLEGVNCIRKRTLKGLKRKERHSKIIDTLRDQEIIATQIKEVKCN